MSFCRYWGFATLNNFEVKGTLPGDHLTITLKYIIVKTRTDIMIYRGIVGNTQPLAAV